jgi:hypothetical protein
MNIDAVRSTVGTRAALLLAFSIAPDADKTKTFSGQGFFVRETESPQTLTSQDADATARFFELVRRWKRESRSMSSTTDMVELPSYREIIALGEVAVPLLLAQLKGEGREPNHWFSALRQITGVDPVPREARGRPRDMARAWIAWGSENYG